MRGGGLCRAPLCTAVHTLRSLAASVEVSLVQGGEATGEPPRDRVHGDLHRWTVRRLLQSRRASLDERVARVFGGDGDA